MKNLKRIIVKIVCAAFLLYFYNIVFVSFNMMIPINLISILIVSLFGPIGLVEIILFQFFVL